MSAVEPESATFEASELQSVTSTDHRCPECLCDLITEPVDFSPTCPRCGHFPMWPVNKPAAERAS